MGKQRFHFNAAAHRYEATRPGLGQRLIQYGIPFAISLILSFGIRYSLGRQINNPKEIKLLAEKEAILDQYSFVDKKVNELEEELRDLQYRDDNLYRSYYELEPISASLREAGLGGAEQYSNLQGYESSALMVDLTRRLDKASVKLEVQSNSFKALLNKAEYHRQLLNCKPSIQPISLQNFYWISSVYGYRTDPMSRRRTMHWGLDFAGREGLDVYATGDGIVVRTKVSKYGFGKEVLIDHGFGYVTRYGHLKEILVKTGHEVKRGSVIGKLGNTGKSTGPHLHYEVRHYGVAKNPKHYYSEDLNPQEYSAIVSQAGSVEN
jgi:murein DD-endopeptidase MepM/ murein hydrolase activator NlpD